jgi:hypothetical protein
VAKAIGLTSPRAAPVAAHVRDVEQLGAALRLAVSFRNLLVCPWRQPVKEGGYALRR